MKMGTPENKLCAKGATHPSLGQRPRNFGGEKQGLKARPIVARLHEWAGLSALTLAGGIFPGALPQAGMDSGLWPSCFATPAVFHSYSAFARQSFVEAPHSVRGILRRVFQRGCPARSERRRKIVSAGRQNQHSGRACSPEIAGRAFTSSSAFIIRSAVSKI